jgi:uncharacterized integral membrane protein
MKRWLLIPSILLVVLASLVFAVQNATEVALDLYGLQLSAPLGVVVLGSLFLGCLLGGMALLLGVIVPLRLRLRQARRREAGSADGGVRQDPAA